MSAKSNVPAMFRPLARYVDFQGRSNRAEFWLFLLFVYFVQAIICGVIWWQSLRASVFDWDLFFAAYMRYSPLMSLFGLAILLPHLAVRVRRLHDIGRSGWWILAPSVVGIIAYMVFFAVNGEAFFRTVMAMSEQMKTDDPAFMMNPAAVLKLELPLFRLILPWVMIPTLVAELVLWVFFAQPGTKGDNRFGPAPAKG